MQDKPKYTKRGPIREPSAFQTLFLHRTVSRPEPIDTVRHDARTTRWPSEGGPISPARDLLTLSTRTVTRDLGLAISAQTWWLSWPGSFFSLRENPFPSITSFIGPSSLRPNQAPEKQKKEETTTQTLRENSPFLVPQNRFDPQTPDQFDFGTTRPRSSGGRTGSDRCDKEVRESKPCKVEAGNQKVKPWGEEKDASDNPIEQIDQNKAPPCRIGWPKLLNIA